MPWGWAQAERIPVAAASDLIHALEELGQRFHAHSGHELSISFGSSGNLSRQIEQGAPFEIFFSANEEYVFRLIQQGHTRGQGVLYALGRLVLFVPQDSTVTLEADLSSLERGLQDATLKRLAIANPEHAPYGMAARTALQQAGLWDAVQKILVLGENAAQSARFSISGSVDAGLIPHAIALTPGFAEKGRFILLADTLYAPLRQRMVLLKNAGSAAEALFQFMQSAEAREVLKQYGFQAPAS